MPRWPRSSRRWLAPPASGSPGRRASRSVRSPPAWARRESGARSGSPPDANTRRESRALGALPAGVGATREWAAIGFTADVEHAADVSVHGIDVWEGKVVLFAAVAALLVMLAMRISGSRSTRRGLAIALIVLGALCVALPVADAVRAKDRFGGVEGVDRLTRTLSVRLRLREEVVRERLRA